MTDAHVPPIVEAFLHATRDERPSLARPLYALPPAARRLLAGVLGRFDRRRSGTLDAQGRLLACRVLLRLRTIDEESLGILNRVLDYLDLDANAHLDEHEMALCVEVLEAFARAESDNDSISVRELKMLYAVLRHLDANHTGRLEPHEVETLRDHLARPGDPFMTRQRAENPFLREFLAAP